MSWQPSGLANIKTRLTLDGLMEPTEKVVLVPLPWGQVFDRYHSQPAQAQLDSFERYQVGRDLATILSRPGNRVPALTVVPNGHQWHKIAVGHAAAVRKEADAGR